MSHELRCKCGHQLMDHGFFNDKKKGCKKCKCKKFKFRGKL